MLKESVKTRDITGGLPRVGELFEARRPKTPAVLSQVSGIVSFQGITQGQARTSWSRTPSARSSSTSCRWASTCWSATATRSRPASLLCDGATDPHDILMILGENALQHYLMNEVQEVYRLQGVNINDKHIGVIVRQMMRRSRSCRRRHQLHLRPAGRPHRFHEENQRVDARRRPARGRAAAAARDHAGLANIDSFISAASFQETTRVLTNAAIAGNVDKLRGLKENVIIGHLIPAGTGIKRYHQIKLYDENREDLDVRRARSSSSASSSRSWRPLRRRAAGTARGLRGGRGLRGTAASGCRPERRAPDVRLPEKDVRRRGQPCRALGSKRQPLPMPTGPAVDIRVPYVADTSDVRDKESGSICRRSISWSEWAASRRVTRPRRRRCSRAPRSAASARA